MFNNPAYYNYSEQPAPPPYQQHQLQLPDQYDFPAPPRDFPGHPMDGEQQPNMDGGGAPGVVVPPPTPPAPGGAGAPAPGGGAPGGPPPVLPPLQKGAGKSGPSGVQDGGGFNTPASGFTPSGGGGFPTSGKKGEGGKKGGGWSGGEWETTPNRGKKGANTTGVGGELWCSS